MNVLLIVSDMHHRDWAGCYGHPVVRTPHIDRLAREGVRFTRCVSASPVCSPFRASLGREKYIWRSHQGTELFFDLRADPHETRNLAASAQHADRVVHWRQRLIDTPAPRQQDGLVKDGQLVRGVRTTAYRQPT
jgi:hypothetical protein